MSRRQLVTVVAAMGTTVAIAACGSPSGQGVPALSDLVAAAAEDPVLDDPALGPALDPAADPGLEPATGDGDGSGGDGYAPTPTSGSDRNGSVAGDSAPRTSTPGKAVQGRIATRLVAKEVPQLGEVVTDQKGAIVYRFEKDSPQPPTSNCNGACATTWPPVLVEGTPDLEGVSAGKVGTVKRADGRTQVTLGGWPLYYFSKDTKPGDRKGQGVGGTWFAVAKDGKKNTNGVKKTAPAAAAPAAAGLVVTELVVVHHPQLGNVVTDQRGAIVYRFEKDSRQPPTSNCNGACAKTWPPALVKTQIRVQGISPELVGKVKRTDGSSQLTLAGWPLYYYSKDTKPGDAKGQGVDGAWSVATNDGQKNASGAPGNVVPPAARTTPPAAAGYDNGSY